MSNLNTIIAATGAMADAMKYQQPYLSVAFTSPIFTPTRSRRIKNKLHRKYYGRAKK